MIYPELKEIIKKEGDFKEFQYKGYKCQIKRVGIPYSGHLCGYIALPENHKLHGVGYVDIDDYYRSELPAHGGLTFSDFVDGDYLIGFDCAHLGDSKPMYLDDEHQFQSLGDTYKDMDYVENNIKEIIDFIEKENENDK